MEGGTRVTSRETSNGQRFGACVAARGVRLGPAHVTGTALDRSVAFYGDVVGLGVHRRESAVAALGDGEGEEVLVLVEEQGAAPAVARRPVPRRPAYPSREELAHAAGRIALTRTPIEGASDHGTHEAIYSLTPTQRPRARRGPPARALAREPRGTTAAGAPRGRRPARRYRGLGAATPRRAGRRRRPPAPARRRRRAGLAFYPRRRRLRGHGPPAERRLRGRGYRHHRFNVWRGRRPSARRRRRAPSLDGRAPDLERRRRPSLARGGRVSRSVKTACSCATCGVPRC